MDTTTGKTLELASNRFLALERTPMFLGSEMPSNIVVKEIIDNEIDIVGERGQKADKAIIYLSKGRIKVTDNGRGITPDDDINGRPSLYHSHATMFSSSNYSKNSTDTIGANGVGLVLANYNAQKFVIMNFNGRSVKGYEWTDGYLNGEESDEVEVPQYILDMESGDHVKHPLSFADATEKYKPFFERGFMVDVRWHKTPHRLFTEPADLKWLVDYARVRTGEIRSGEIEIHTFKDDEFKEETGVYIFNKDKESEYYVPSWEERCQEAGAVMIKDGPWTFAYGISEEMKIDSICQGGLIRVPYTRNISIQIQDESIAVSVPFTMRYLSDEYPPYTDQTKVAVRIPYSYISNDFERSGDVYHHFYREAEKAYMSKVIKDSDSSMFWPCLGPTEEGELIIAEGYSAISGLKSQRNPQTQACIALRGKIQNCWNLDMIKAMRSDIVKQMLNAVIYNKYKRIIIAVDADDDGGHIASLLISLFYRFTNIIQEGRLYYVHTPHYLFKKGKDLKWSDDANDCPTGYHVTTLKGLGGMDADQVGKFIMDSSTRDLIQIVDDPEAEKSLDFAFSTGGEDWIINE